jgi:hypothetical protein
MLYPARVGPGILLIGAKSASGDSLMPLADRLGGRSVLSVSVINPSCLSECSRRCKNSSSRSDDGFYKTMFKIPADSHGFTPMSL